MPWHDPPLRTPAMQILADGEHDGLRWWLHHMDGEPALHFTVCGHVAGNLVIEFAEFRTADPAAVEGYMARLVDRKRTAWARKAEMAAASGGVAAKAGIGGLMLARPLIWSSGAEQRHSSQVRPN